MCQFVVIFFCCSTLRLKQERRKHTMTPRALCACTHSSAEPVAGWCFQSELDGIHVQHTQRSHVGLLVPTCDSLLNPPFVASPSSSRPSPTELAVMLQVFLSSKCCEQCCSLSCWYRCRNNNMHLCGRYCRSRQDHKLKKYFAGAWRAGVMGSTGAEAGGS